MLGALKSRDERRRAARYLRRVVIPGCAMLLMYFVLRLLPVAPVSAFGAWGVGLYGKNNRLRQERVLHNLARLRPDLASDVNALEAAAHRYWRNIGRTLAEVLVIHKMIQADLPAVIGEAHLAASRATGRRRIWLLLHLGNWELAGPKLLAIGEDSSHVVHTIANPFTKLLLARTRRQFAGRLIYAGPKVGHEIFRTLRDKGAIVLAGDEFIRGQLFAPSFGRPLKLDGNLGRIVRLAKMTNAIVCPVYCARAAATTFELHILPHVELDLERDDYLAEGVRRLDQVITPVIVAHLDQWFLLDNFRLPDAPAS